MNTNLHMYMRLLLVGDSAIYNMYRHLHSPAGMYRLVSIMNLIIGCWIIHHIRSRCIDYIISPAQCPYLLALCSLFQLAYLPKFLPADWMRA